MRLIDADVLLQKVKEAINQFAKHRDILRMCADVKDAVMKAPTIEAEPVKHGRWKDDGCCSVCDEEAVYFWERSEHCYTTRCPHCGAKMDSMEDDAE